MAKFLFSAFADEASHELDKQIEALKRNNLKYIEPRNLDGKTVSKITVEEAKEVAEKLKKGGIKVSSIGSFYGKIEITDDFEPHFEEFKNTVEVAKVLGAKYIRLFSFYFKNGESYEEYRDEVIRRLKIMTEYALDNGIQCLHENEKEIYGDTAERCLDILKALDGKLLAVFDPANFIQCGEDTLKAYDMLEEYVEYMHIKDCNEDKIVVPAGEGLGNISVILKRFREKEGTTNFVSLEPHLKEFVGLADLEGGAKTKMLHSYATNEEAFDAAVAALDNVIKNTWKRVKLGIIGVGNIGTSHTRRIMDRSTEYVDLVAIADLDESKFQRIKDITKNPDLICYNSGSELIASGTCEAVIICTPHYGHPELGIEAMEHGLHVLSEKPAGVYTKRVREMNETAAKSGLVFAMMFNQRTNHVYRKVKELVSSGKYGEMKRVNWIITNWYRSQSYYDSGSWRATWEGEGGGVLLNQCPHNLDLWQWICGMPNKVRAFCHESKWHNIEVEDDVTIYCEYPNGATGVFVTSTADTPGTNRLEITLDKAKIVCDSKTVELYETEVPERQFCFEYKGGFGEPKCTHTTVETDGMNFQHAEIVSNFAKCIIDGTPLIAEGYEGINGLMISNAAHLSSWLDKTIELPVDEDLFYEKLQEKIANSSFKKETTELVVEDMDSSFQK